MSSTTQTSAIVTSTPVDNVLQWKLETIEVQPLAENELLIDVVASGLCHTDITASLFPTSFGGYPKVVGHEGEFDPALNLVIMLRPIIAGAGYVKEVGSKVTFAKVGDPVVLSFASCKACHSCTIGHPAYCEQFFGSNFPINSGTYAASDGSKVGGGFFGQSSFSKLAVAKEISVVNLSGLVKDVEELKLFAPLGCGLQTGAASVFNRARTTSEDTVAVVGLGGVGMAAIMARGIFLFQYPIVGEKPDLTKI
jgi:Zn-dependent alcohol dehydrogenase